MTTLNKPPLPDRLTPLSHADLIAALRDAFPVVFGRPAKAPELAIYFAQIVTENGARLQSLHWFCFGNAKATLSWTGDTTQYECDETVTAPEAAHAQTLGPCELHPQPSGKVRIVCFPPHPWTTFRAFQTAAEGVAAYLDLFALPRYAQAALRAKAGDAVGFVEMAKAGGYFTAPDVSAYARCVSAIAAQAAPACFAAVAIPVVTDADRSVVAANIAAAAMDIIVGPTPEPFPLEVA